MVEREGALETVGRDMSAVPVPADVVDQHIDAGVGLQHLTGQPPDLRLRREVCDEHIDARAGRGADLAGRPFGPLTVAAGDRHACPHRGKARGGRPADA